MCPLSEKSKMISIKVWKTIYLDKESLLKYLNYLTLLLGLAFIIVAFASKYKFDQYEYILKNEICGPACFSLALGGIMILFTIFGCLIVINKKFEYFNIYITLLVLICFMEITAGPIASFTKTKTEKQLEKLFRDSLPKYAEKYRNIIIVWDNIQNTFNCCGIRSYEDWSDHIGKNKSLPLSCCFNNKSDEVDKCFDSSPEFRFEGCLPRFTEHINHYFTYLETVGYGAASIQVVLLVFGFIILKQMKKFQPPTDSDQYDQSSQIPNNQYEALKISRNGPEVRLELGTLGS